MSRRSLAVFSFGVSALACAGVLLAAIALPGLVAGSSADAGGNGDGDRRPVARSAPTDRPGDLPRIRGSVGPGFTISVNRQQVAPGRYQFVINDQSSMHNWHITGPGGVNKKTQIAFTGTKRFTLTLSAGRYTIKCDVHPTQMLTHLRVRKP